MITEKERERERVDVLQVSEQHSRLSEFSNRTLRQSPSTCSSPHPFSLDSLFTVARLQTNPFETIYEHEEPIKGRSRRTGADPLQTKGFFFRFALQLLHARVG